MSPETRTLLDIYMALREKHLDDFVRYHSDLPIELRNQFEKAWNNFSDCIGAAHLAEALFQREKSLRAAKAAFRSLSPAAQTTHRSEL